MSGPNDPISPDGLHKRIRAEAAAVRALEAGDWQDIEACPALRAFLDAAMARIEASAPAFVDFEGSRYWLCVRLDATIGIHDTPAAALPLALVRSEGVRWVGHKPGH